MALQRHRVKRPGAARTEKAFKINVPTAIVRSVASCCACSAGCAAMIAWEAAAGPTVHRQGSRFARPARASEARRLGNTQAITRCGGPLQFQEPLQLHEPMQLQSWVGIFAQHHTERRAMAGPRAFDGLCDDEGVPLICPTCQVLAQSVPAGERLLPCMGLFSIFLVGSHSDAAWLRESCLKPHTRARPLL